MAASRLSVIERGYDEPTETERAELARVLGISKEDLFPDQRQRAGAKASDSHSAPDTERAPR